jgi:hypothetical protein
MGKIPVQGDLFPPEPGGSDVVYVNGRCQIRREGSALVVLVSGLPVAHFSDEDRPAVANAMVMLVEHGWAQQAEVNGPASRCAVHPEKSSRGPSHRGGKITMRACLS